jgi:hypothetical protein
MITEKKEKYLRRREEFESKSANMYGVLKGNCSRRTLDVIEKAEDFANWSLRNDHQSLWRRIREIFLNDVSSTESKELRQANQLAAFSALRIKPEQTLQQFYNVYKLELETARSLGNVLLMKTELRTIKELIPNPAFRGISTSNEELSGEENSSTSGRILRSNRNNSSNQSNLVPEEISRIVQVPVYVEDEAQVALDFLLKLDRRFELMMLDLHNSSSKGRNEYPRDLLSAVHLAQSWKKLPEKNSKNFDAQNVQFVSLEQKTNSHSKKKKENEKKDKSNKTKNHLSDSKTEIFDKEKAKKKSKKMIIFIKNPINPIKNSKSSTPGIQTP